MAEQQEADKPKLARAKAPLPPKFKVEDDGVSTRLTWRWFNFTHIFLIFFCIAWDSFLVTWYGIAFTQKDAPLIMIIFPIAHVAVGGGAQLLHADGAGEPHPHRGEPQPAHDPSRSPALARQHGCAGPQFTQLYGVENVSTNKGRETTTYDLMALERSGRTVKLLSGLTDKDQVLYLEQTLERRLGIEDAPVDGEVATRTHAA